MRCAFLSRFAVILPRHRHASKPWHCETQVERTQHAHVIDRMMVLLYIPQNVADIKKLKQVGICTIKGIQMTTRKRLGNIKGISEAKVDKIKVFKRNSYSRLDIIQLTEFVSSLGSCSETMRTPGTFHISSQAIYLVKLGS